MSQNPGSDPPREEPEVPALPRRPLSVTALGAATLMSGLSVLGLGVLGVIASQYLPDLGQPERAAMVLAFGSVSIIVGGGWIASGFGLLRIRGWAWWLAVGMSGLAVPIGPLSLPAGYLTIGLGALLLVLLLLMRVRFRAIERQGAASREPSS